MDLDITARSSNPMRVAFALLCISLVACGHSGSNGASTSDLCAAGAIGCPCASGDACGTTSSGESLRCLDEVCTPMTCASGSTGCVCRGGTRCDEAGATCSSGICKLAGCVAGTASCDCLLGTCDAGLYCDASLGGGTCVDGAGFPGGSCPTNALCHDQSRCDHATNTCIHCELGSQGCPPDHGSCNQGLVYAVGRCLPRNEVPPDAPKCYTPCSGDVRTTSGVLTCDSEGFLAGCLPGLECVDGSCVPQGADRTSCSVDSDCPAHQSCLADGHCYSNCEANTDCPSGLACHLHVCRAPCSANSGTDQACSADFRCDMQDGATGFCMPRPSDSPADPPPAGPSATYAVTPTSLQLTAQEPGASVRLTNGSSSAEHFTVRKVWHRAFNRQGMQVLDSRAASAPLWFMAVTSDDGTANADGSLDVVAPASCADDCPTITFERASTLPTTWARVEGRFEIAHPTMGTQSVDFAYRAGIDGRWTGKMFYFASFPDVRLAEWRAGDRSTDNDVGNGLIAKWSAYRAGRLDTFAEMQAVLNSTVVGSWKWPTVASACSTSSGVGACYLFDSDATGQSVGVVRYVDNRVATPIPSGVTEFPIALNLRSTGVDASGRSTMSGIIDSAVALQYGGNPRIDVAFATAPDDLTHCDSDGVPGDCVTYVADFHSDILVGARKSANADGCSGDLAGLAYTRIPWLVPGFDDGVAAGYRGECRDTSVPFASPDPRNANLVVGNPVADGHSMHRELRLLDGAMIDQHQLFVLFEETFVSSLRTAPLSTYGYMLLEKSDQTVADSELVSGTTGTTVRAVTGPSPLGSTTCDAAIALASARLPTGVSLPTTMSDVDRASMMLTGRIPGASATAVSNVHYLCVDTGLFDGGPGNTTGTDSDIRIPCPNGSNVRYFILPNTFTQASVAALDCQQDGTCGSQLQTWLGSDLDIVPDPTWSCTDPTATSCSSDRYDLRDGKIFYAPGPTVFVPLDSAISDAFRYKTRFQSMTDRSVGFAPVPCIGSGDLTPYCYDAKVIEEATARVDCLVSTYANHVGEWHDDRWQQLRLFLTSALSVHTSGMPSGALTDGFERFYSELLVMLGDDAMTHALGSRFDLAATNGASFFGAELEVGGMNVAGTAGYEMRELYEAVQYYEMTSDRFFTRIAPVVFAAIEAGDVGANHVVSPALVTTYLERLVGGSTKKAAAWSYIADRYRGLDRPDLAHAVMQRAYMGTYVESMLFARLVLDVAAKTDGQDRTAIVALLERAQAQYSTALARMREVYDSIGDEGARFGLSPDDIPFPAVDDSDTRYSNAFEAVLGLARARTDTARLFENAAIDNSRAFETDQASFQSELVQISVDKEKRLAELCGSFTGSDGRVHPAIARYAYLSDRTAALGDPCGFVGNGEIHDKNADIALLESDVHEFRDRIQRIGHRIDLEDQRVDAQCARLGSLRDLEIGQMERRRSMQTEIGVLENRISAAERFVGNVGQAANLASCSLFDCPAVPEKVAGFLAAAAASEVVIDGLSAGVLDLQSEMTSSEIDQFRAQIDSQCASIQIDSVPVVADLFESITQLDHDVAQTVRRGRLALDQLEALRLEAKRTQQEQDDAETLAIDVEASRNDPNVRVYMNTAMLNADRSFNRALEHAFRATRILEYFESQSYAHADELYLIRMVSRGEYNLDNYLDELEDEYEAFRVQYRTRSQRAVRLSLANDIFKIPTIDDQGRPLSIETRNRMMRDRLLDPSRLDANGRRTFEFRTTLDQFAPCTFGHQIEYIEVMLSGANLGDANASVMLWQDGTGVVERADQGQNFHRLPPALIVATPRRDLDTAFDPSVYRNYGMRERPLVNTSWKLVFDEFNPQNRDIKFAGLNDIFIYVYYTDFTNPDACR